GLARALAARRTGTPRIAAVGHPADDRNLTARPALRSNATGCATLGTARILWPPPLPARMLALRVPLVLASQSPRRRQLLERLRLPFSVQPSAVDETLPADLAPAAAAEALARQKARAVARDHPVAL